MVMKLKPLMMTLLSPSRLRNTRPDTAFQYLERDQRIESRMSKQVNAGVKECCYLSNPANEDGVQSK